MAVAENGRMQKVTKNVLYDLLFYLNSQTTHFEYFIYGDINMRAYLRIYRTPFANVIHSLLLIDGWYKQI